MKEPDFGSTARNRTGSTAPADRGLSPVVGKTLELGVGVLFVALLTTTLFGGLAPEYRDAVGAELGDRALVAAAERAETAVPDGDLVGRVAAAGVEAPIVERRIALRLPETIREDSYRIVAESTKDESTATASSPSESTLALVHPDPRIGGRIRLAVPASATVTGSISSESASAILVYGDVDGLVVRLVDEGEFVTAGPESVAQRGTTR
ncbi:DUF7266 family protein [Halobellus salinisoli]|uniref:DUF7266 family protein n=1 Tax=Halobellus salinisoli TaxID=3108500 RepID=UPI0030095F8F